MAHVDDLIIRAEAILANPGRVPFDSSLLLALLVEIARNTRLAYDESRPFDYETPAEAYDRGAKDQKKRA